MNFKKAIARTIVPLLLATSLGVPSYSSPQDSHVKYEGLTIPQLRELKKKNFPKVPDQCNAPVTQKKPQKYVQPAHLEVYNGNGSLAQDITLRAERVPVVTFTDANQYARFVPPKQRVASEISSLNNKLGRKLLDDYTITAQELSDNNITTKNFFMHYRLLDKQPGPCKTDEYTAAATFALETGKTTTTTTESTQSTAQTSENDSIMRRGNGSNQNNQNNKQGNAQENAGAPRIENKDVVKTFGFDFGAVNLTLENQRKDGTSLEDAFTGMRLGFHLSRITPNSEMTGKIGYVTLSDNPDAAYDPYAQAGTYTSASISGFIEKGFGRHLFKPAVKFGGEYKSDALHTRFADFNQPNATGEAGLGLIVGDKRTTFGQVFALYVAQDQQFQQPYAWYDAARKADHALETGRELQGKIQVHLPIDDNNTFNLYAHGAQRTVKTQDASPTRQVVGTMKINDFGLGVTYWHNNFFIDGNIDWNGNKFLNQDLTKVGGHVTQFGGSIGWRW